MRTVLESIEASAGFLESCGRINFLPGLNCIIGPPGSCKSVLLESIRFAFDCNRDRVEILEGKQDGESGYQNKIGGTLDSGTIMCHVRDLESDAVYSIEREHGGNPRLYRAGVKEHRDTLPIRIEIYSQGELQMVAEDLAQALALIDKPNIEKIEQHKKKRQEYSELLRELGQRLQSERNHLESLRQKVRPLPELRLQLEQRQAARPKVSNDLAEEHANFVGRRHALEAVQSALEARRQALETIARAHNPIADMRMAIELISTLNLKPFRGCLQQLQERHTFLESLQLAIAVEVDNDLTSELSALEKCCEELDEPFYRLREDEQSANEWMKAEQRLKGEISELEVAEKEGEQAEEEISRLLSERTRLREVLQKCSDEIYAMRACEVDEINRLYAHDVILRLSPGANCEKYASEMKALLNRSRLHDQATIARELVETLKPAEIIDIVEGGDASPLAEALGRDLSQMTRLLSFLMDSPNFYSLETLVFDDELSISMFDNGTPKPLQELSKGQKATALLPLILRHAPYPLIFDQPEDDLDNRFISKTLIEMVARLKTDRQIIFVTHNANIPVLGNADCVIVMQMQSAKQAGRPSQGTVDEQRDPILEFLEGGKEAFQHRQEIYERLFEQPSES